MNHILSVGSGLLSVVGTIVPFYYETAPQFVSSPYGIIQFMSGIDDYALDDNTWYADYIVKVVSDNYYPYNAVLNYGSVHTQLQDNTFSVSGYEIIKLRRESVISFKDDKERWHVGGLYNVWITNQ